MFAFFNSLDTIYLKKYLNQYNLAFMVLLDKRGTSGPAKSDSTVEERSEK